MKEMKVEGRLVQKTEWKQMDKQTDKKDCIILLANMVGNNGKTLKLTCTDGSFGLRQKVR